MAEPSASGTRSGGIGRDAVYRRPPARPGTTGTPWFGAAGSGTGELPVTGEPGDDAADGPLGAAAGRPGAADGRLGAAARPGAAGGSLSVAAGQPSSADAGLSAPADRTSPEAGPGVAGGSSRISFGFDSGPISPVRHPASPTSPAAPASVPATPAAPASVSAAPAAPAAWPTAGRDSVDMPKAGSSATASRRSTGTGDHRFVSGDVRFTDTGQRPAATGDRGYTGPADRLYTDSADRGLTEGPLGDSGRGLADTGEQRISDAVDRLTDTGERRLSGAAGRQPAERHFTDTAERWLSDTAERGYVLSEAVRATPPGAPVTERAVPEPPRQSRAVTVGIVLLSIVVLVTGSIVGVVYFTGSDDKLDAVLQLGAGDGRRTASAPLDNRAKASFELLAATNKVNVRIGELGDELYRISTPEDAGIAPDPEIRNDDVKLQVTRDGDGTGGEIDIVLAAKVRWTLRFSGYAEEQLVDLSGGQIGGIEMVGGMRRAEVTLPRPSGTVPIKVNGAVEQLTLKSPQGSPVRVRVGGGAKTVVAGSRTLRDIAAGSTLTPKGWAVPDRYDVGAGAPITSLTVQNA